MRFTAYVRFRTTLRKEHPRGRAHIPMEVKELFKPWARGYTQRYGSNETRPDARIDLGTKYGSERIYSDHP